MTRPKLPHLVPAEVIWGLTQGWLYPLLHPLLWDSPLENYKTLFQGVEVKMVHLTDCCFLLLLNRLPVLIPPANANQNMDFAFKSSLHKSVRAAAVRTAAFQAVNAHLYKDSSIQSLVLWSDSWDICTTKAQKIPKNKRNSISFSLWEMNLKLNLVYSVFMTFFTYENSKLFHGVIYFGLF